jgi:cysteine-rich repeat protein
LRGIELTAGKCDDGNLIADDGCSAICVVNTGFTCTGAPSVCTPVCGDGKLVGYETGARFCDDSNTRIDDGCIECKTQRLYSCTGAPSVCVNLCGNKRWNPAVYEDCDNGNSTVEDGCSNIC